MDNVLNYAQTDELGLSTQGEVCLNKELESIIAHCKKIYKIPYIYISSNGSLMDKQRAISLLESGLDSIKFSINATDAKNYKKVHKKDDFDRVIENFSALLELKEQSYPHLKLYISSVLTPNNTKNPRNEFHKIFGNKSQYINAIALYGRNITQKEHLQINGGGGQNLFNETIDDSSKPSHAKLLCSKPFDEIWINSSGCLILCCQDFFSSINFVSLLENDFYQLYYSEPFMRIREMFKSQNFPPYHLCKQCLTNRIHNKLQ